MANDYGLATNRVEEFAKNFAELSDEKRKTKTRLWQLARDAEIFRQTSSSPEDQTDFYAGDPNRSNPFSDIPFVVAPDERERLTSVYDEITATIENLYTRNPEQDAPGMAMFLKYDMDDLRLMAADASFGIDLDWLARRHYAAAAHQEWLQSIEDEVDKRYEAALRGNDFGVKAEYTGKVITDLLFGGSASTDFKEEVNAGDRALSRKDIENDVWLEFTGQRDKVYEEEIGVWRERRKAQILEETQVADIAEELGYGAVDGYIGISELEQLVASDADPEKLAKFNELVKSRRRWTEEHQKLLDDEEATYRSMIIAGGDPTGTLGIESGPQKVLGAGLGAIGTVLDWGISGVGSVFSLVDRVTPEQLEAPLNPYDWLQDRQKNRQAEAVAELEANMAMPDDELLFRANQAGMELVWREEKQNNTDSYRSYLAAAGGDEVVAAGLFFGDVQDAPEVKRAAQQLMLDIREQDDRFLQDLREQDFRFSHEVLDVLGMYARNGPMRLATGVMLLATDSDYQDLLVSAEWGRLWNEIGDEASRLDFSPSAAVGIDGSFLGLVTDLGMGLAFDPATWFVGPKYLGANRAGKQALATAANARAVVRSAPMRAVVDDIINFAQSPYRGSSQLWHLTSWLDDTARAEIFELVGVVDEVITAPVRSQKHVMEVGLPFLEKLVVGADKVRASAKKKISSIGESLVNKGQEKPIVVRVGRSDGRVHIADGTKRILAASDSEGLSRLYAVLEIVDEVPGGTLLDDLLDGQTAKFSIDPEPTTFKYTLRMDSLFPGEVLFGKVNKDLILDSIERAVMRGVDPSVGARSVINSSLRGRVAQFVKNTPGLRGMERFLSQQNTNTRVFLHGDNVIGNILDNVVKMWGDDTVSASRWTSRFLEWQAHNARLMAHRETLMAALRPQVETLIRLRELLDGRIWDKGTLIDETINAKSAIAKDASQAKARANIVAQRLQEETLAYEKALRRVHKEIGDLPSNKDLATLVEGMWNDFNRTHIVPAWKSEIAKRPNIYDAEAGIVKWDALTPGKKHVDEAELRKTEDFFPETVHEYLNKHSGLGENAGKRMEEMYRLLNAVPNNLMSINMPLAPIDMIAAASMSGAKWIRWQHRKVVYAAKDAAHKVQRAWRVDKVLRPATAMTVSADEWLRIFHTFGAAAAKRYLQDRILFTRARIQATKAAKRVPQQSPGKPNVLFGSSDRAVRRAAATNEKLQKRLTELDEHVVRAQEWERLFYDDAGLGWTDIYPDDPIYHTAAQQWVANFMQDSGFRAFLRGKEEFLEWWDTNPDALQAKKATAAHRRRKDTGDTDPDATVMEAGFIRNPEDVYNGWQVLFHDVIMKQHKVAGSYDEAMRAIRETAKKIDDSGGRPHNVPEVVIQNLGPVRGTQRHSLRADFSPLRLTDTFFDNFFLDPVNYRRGFVADMVAAEEKARITSLLTSQGIRIVTDAELSRALGLKGLANAVSHGVRDILHREGLRRKMVPQSYVDSLVQKAVNREVDHMLYVAERGSVAGRRAEGVFPFGKPYADMMAFWAREGMRRPHWRGQMIERNLARIEAAAGDTPFGPAVSALRNFNPRTPALVSRIANTDMSIDRGWDAGLFSDLPEDASAGLWPGSESTDFSPVVFLPTANENPFYSLVPGIGYVPLWGIDMLLANLKDPIEDPEGYSDLLDSVGDFVGGAFFGSPNPGLSLFQRVLGGGTFGQATEAAMDISTLFGGGSGFAVASTALGQPDREVDRGRNASALMADPERLEELFALETKEEIDLWIDATAAEADRNAAFGNLMEQVPRFLLPAGNKYSGELDVLWDVWVEAGTLFDYLGVDTSFNSASASPEQRRDYANDVRNNFFNLPQWRRDATIAQFPQLAVNLVSTWDWTDYAHDSRIPDTHLSYRTDGSEEGLARHDLYVRTGYVRPLSPQERIRRIVGLIMTSRDNTAKFVYEHAAGNVNDLLWEFEVTDRDKNAMTWLLEGWPEKFAAVDIRNERELWEQFSGQEEDIELMLANFFGVEPVRGESTKKADRTEFDDLRSQVNLDVAPWSPRWPGTDPDNLPKRMEEFPAEFLFDPVIAEAAAAVGMDLNFDSMSGREFYEVVQKKVTDTNTTLRLNVMPAYETYVGSRSVVSRVVDQEMKNLIDFQDYSEEWRNNLEDFMDFENSISERYRESVLGIPPSEQLKVQDRFISLYESSDDVVVNDWQALWDMAFARRFGPLHWEPPTPKSPFNDDGSPAEGSWQPIIHEVIDGDSLRVSESVTGVEHEVRLLGVRARDYGLDDEGAAVDKARLWTALLQAKSNDDSIYLVRDPGQYGRNVDNYGRELAWLWIGDEPFWFSDEMYPNRDPSGGDD